MSRVEEDVFVQVDQENNVIGPIKKSDSCAKGVLHRTVSVLVFNQAGELLIQLRPKDKDLYPGLYTLSATGHVDWTENGPESYEEAALREYREELGKDPVGPLIPKMTIELDAPGHHIWPRVYFTQDEGPFHTNPEEVEKVEFLPLEEVRKLADKITPPSRMVLERLGLI